MGREIRRVPADWQHPVDGEGNYIPMFDMTYEENLADWQERKDAFDSNPEERRRAAEKYGCDTFEEWDGPPQPKEVCRPAFDNEPTHYQIYETVTEGTPRSPVFASLGEMRSWLLEEGYSNAAATRFVETGWAPSLVMTITEDGPKMSGFGIHSLDDLPEQQIIP